MPLAIALDDDQGQNAKVLAEAGGGRGDPRGPTHRRQPGRRAAATCWRTRRSLPVWRPAARTIASLDAAERLADLVREDRAIGPLAPARSPNQGA